MRFFRKSKNLKIPSRPIVSNIQSLHPYFRGWIRIDAIPLEQGWALEGRKYSEGEEVNKWLRILQRDI
jgi:hypothetical protein